MDLVYRCIYDKLQFIDKLNFQRSLNRRLNTKKSLPEFYCFICQSKQLDKMLTVNWSHWVESICYHHFIGDCILLDFFLDIAQSYLQNVFHTRNIDHFENHIQEHLLDLEESFYPFHPPLADGYLSETKHAIQFMLTIYKDMADFKMSWPRFHENENKIPFAWRRKENTVIGWYLYNIKILNNPNDCLKKDQHYDNYFIFFARLFETKVLQPNNFKSSEILRTVVLKQNPEFGIPIMQILTGLEFKNRFNLSWPNLSFWKILVCPNIQM